MKTEDKLKQIKERWLETSIEPYEKTALEHIEFLLNEIERLKGEIT